MAAPAQAANWRILCIDDEPDLLEILKTILGMEHEVVTAHDGVEAVGMLDLCEADFVICDVRMPRMDGFQTVEAIRRHPDYVDIPVFFLTAETGREKAKQGFAAGCDLYLTKPFDAERLLENIRHFQENSGRSPRPKRLTPDQAEEAARGELKTAPAAAQPVATGLPRVIVVSPRDSDLSTARTALSQSCECVVCADPLNSINQLFRYEPDVLIINPAIPQLSGWGLVQLIRQNPRLKGLSILLIDDPMKKFDERLVPAITSQPLIPAGASAAQVASAVENLVGRPDFRIRPKTSRVEDLVASEAEAKKRIDVETVKNARAAKARRDRYSEIQDWIDKNRS